MVLCHMEDDFFGKLGEYSISNFINKNTGLRKQFNMKSLNRFLLLALWQSNKELGIVL